jgi:transcriptional regulator with XRE-family HTH domain
MKASRTTPNQCVAHNLRSARLDRDWTQEEAAERLAPYIGSRWSKAVFSAAERSVTGERVRQFTADDLYAFSRAFELPITFFLTPPAASGDSIGHAAGGDTSSRLDYLDLLFDLPEGARRLLDRKVFELSAPMTRALRRWGANFVALVAQNDKQVEALLELRSDEE